MKVRDLYQALDRLINMVIASARAFHAAAHPISIESRLAVIMICRLMGE